MEVETAARMYADAEAAFKIAADVENGVLNGEPYFVLPEDFPCEFEDFSLFEQARRYYIEKLSHYNQAAANYRDCLSKLEPEKTLVSIPLLAA